MNPKNTLIAVLLGLFLGFNTSAQSENDLQHYLKLKDALVASDLEASQKAALEMQSSLYEGASEALNTSLQNLSASQDLAGQRKYFEEVSQEMYKALKASNEAKGLYKQYCPMAFNGKGAFWLSDKKQIANPYYGDRMLRCGRVEEEL